MAPDDGRSKTQQIESDGMMRVRVRCVGITPLLHNAMGIEVLLAMRDKSNKKSKASQKVLEPREECLPKLYLDTVGNPVVPVESLFATLRNAGRQVRLDGKKQISTATSTVLPLLMTIESTALHLWKAMDPDVRATWEVDIRKGTNPNGGEAVVLIRPRLTLGASRSTSRFSRTSAARQPFVACSILRGPLSASVISARRAEAPSGASASTSGRYSDW